MNLSTQQKQTHSHTEQTCVCKGGGGGNGMGGVFWVIRCKLLLLEWINNEVLLYSIGNYIQSLGIDHDGRGYKKRNVYVQDWVSAILQKLSKHCKSTILRFLKMHKNQVQPQAISLLLVLRLLASRISSNKCFHFNQRPHTHHTFQMTVRHPPENLLIDTYCTQFPKMIK